MGEDGPGNANAAAAQLPGGDANANAENDKNIPPPKPIESRKSTWAVSAFDIQASGMATPLGTQSKRSSIDLEDYFVCSTLERILDDIIDSYGTGWTKRS
jgi:hypothetical protein